MNVERSKHTETVENLLKEKMPEIVCLEESMKNDASKLASIFGYNLAFAPRVIIEKENGEKDEEGSSILSKYPIKNVKQERYDDKKVEDLIVCKENSILFKGVVRPKDRFLMRSNLLSVSIMKEGKEVTIATTHFPVVDHGTPGSPAHIFDHMEEILDVEYMDIYLERLLSLIRRLNDPVIFTADLNNQRGEYIYDTLAHELDDIVPSSVSSTIDPKIHRKGSELNLCVDTIMVSPNISSDNFEIIEGVSDHKALLVSLDI